MSVTKRGSIYYYDFWFRKKRYQGPTGCTLKEDAFEVQKLVRKELKEGKACTTAPEDQTLGNAIRRYFKDREEQKSLKSSKRYARVLCEQLGPACRILELDHDSVVELRQRIAALNVESRHSGCVREDVARKKGHGKRKANQSNESLPKLATSTVNRHLQFLRRLMRCAAANWKQPVPDINWSKRRNDYLSRLPILKPEHARERVLKADEAVLFAEAARELRPELLGFLEFEAETGLRTETAVSLVWRQIDWARRTITVQLGKIDEDQALHTVSLSPRAVEILRAEKGNHPTRVFTLISRKSGHKGKRIPVTRGNFRKALKEICAKAEIEDFRNHDLRHTAATRLVEAGGNLKDVKELLGVKNDKTAMRYINTEGRVRKIQSEMKPLF